MRSDNSEIDHKLVAAFVLEISDRIKIISDSFPDSKGPILKNLAAASIHLAFFMNDINNDLDGEKDIDMAALQEKFLKGCGCKDEK